jgi:broad specificity phosphatase PhoE
MHGQQKEGHMGDLWLARHGETEWSRSGRHTGRTDVPLTPEGEEQARRLGSLLGGRPFAAVLSSPLRRARETCALAGYGGQAELEPGLVEWDYGRYEGWLPEEIQAEQPGWTVFTHPAPGGEAFHDVAARAERVIARARSAPGDALLFGHGHALRTLALVWTELPATAGDALVLDTASISILGRGRHGVHVICLWNGPGPLGPIPAAMRAGGPA